MATGFSHTLEMGQEVIFDYECTRCKTNTRTMEAFHFCTDCGDLYCGTCLEFHASFPSMKNHKVLGRNEVEQWIMEKGTSSPTTKCSQHHGEVMQVFCGDHYTLCCHVCVAMEHSMCKDKNYIPKMAKGIFQSQELQIIDQDFEDIKFHLDKIKKNREQNKEVLEKSRDHVLQDLNNFRNQVNKIFEDLEKSVIMEMEKLNVKKNEDILADIKMCKSLITDLEKLKHQLEAVKQKCNESEVFINLKKCETKVAEVEQSIHTMYAISRSEIFTFSFDPKLPKLLANIQKLGKLNTMTSNPKATSQTDQKRTIRPYEAEYDQEYNVKTESDIETCSISGSCQLPDKTILLTDLANNKVKRLDTSFRVIDHCDIPSGPTSVCCISKKEAAVTDNDNTINFVSLVSNKMVVYRSLKMKHACQSIAYNNRQLYVTDRRHIYIYNKYVSPCYHPKSLKYLYFTDIKGLVISQDGTKTFVTDQARGLVRLNSKGNILSNSGHNRADGLCLGQDGCVFVIRKGSFRKYQVLQLDKSGLQMVSEVVNIWSFQSFFERYHLHSLLIDTEQSTMMVTEAESDTVTVYNLK